MQGRHKPSGVPLASPIAALVTLLCAVIASLFPLTGTPGPEAAQLLAAIGGPSLLLAGAARGSYRLERGFLGDLTAQGLLVAVALLGFMAIVTVAGVGHESCAPGRGYLPFFALALPVLLLDSAIGLWIGRLVGSARAAVLVGVAAIAAYLLWLVLDWFWEPSFRVLSHLTVLIEGDMLRGRDLSPAGWAYRAATLSLAGALCFAGASRFPEARRGGLSAAPLSNPSFVIAAGTLFVVGAVTHFMSVDKIAPSHSSFEKAYHLERRRGPLVVRADPAQVTAQSADAILAEGTLWLDRLQRRLGVKPEGDITIWLHKDSHALGHWTGAEHVHFALPMTRELHIAGADVPHSTLGHELVHVLGAQLSDNALGVPGRLGILVNSGLIEGLAMAMTPELEVRQGLTLREKAAAMKRAGLAPPPEELFSEYTSMFAFWRHNPGRAYITAGAFVEAIAASRGTEALQQLYREGELEAAFPDDASLAAFLEQNAADLDLVELPDDAVASVARTYARPSILDETCNRAKMADADAIRSAARGGDFDLAERLAQDAEQAITAATFVALAREADEIRDSARATHYRVLSTRTDVDADPIDLGTRLDAAAGGLWRAGERRRAIALWERIEVSKLPPYPQRLVLAKRLLADAIRAAGGREPVAEAALDLVLQDPATGDDGTRLVALSLALEQHGARSTSSVRNFARYLLGRQLIQRGAIDSGLDVLMLAVEDRMPQAPFDEELLRGLAMGHARKAQWQLAAKGFGIIAEQASRSADRTLMRDRQERAETMARSAEPGGHPADAYLLGLDSRGGL